MIIAGATLNNRYKLEKKIGEGGFSNVYQARDLLLGRPIAVKVLDGSLEGNPDFLERFQREAQAVAILDHPNILTIHDFGLLEGSAYIVMPFVAGGPLSARLHQSRPSLNEVAGYLEQLSSALDYAHRNNIVHRDVKPQNVLLRQDGRAVLTDFGFAKRLANVNIEAKTMVLGTVHYMAPEQFQGMVSAATDQYSLGVLLYQLISTALPFTGIPKQIILGHLNQNPGRLANQPSMREIKPEIIARLDQLISRVLSKSPAARFPDCTALYQAYCTAIQSRSPSAGTKEPPNDEITARDPNQVIPTAFSTIPAGPPPRQVTTPHPTSPPIPTPPPVVDGEAPTIPDNPAIARQKSPKMVQSARLTVSTEPDQHVKLSFNLSDEVITLGRELTNTLQLPLAIVSRHHATLHRLGPVGPGMKYRLVDNQSRNQLYYKGRSFTERILEDGDVIEIGKRGYGEYVVYLTYRAPVFSSDPA